MNKDDALKFLPLIIALSEGKTIQYLTAAGDWRDTDDPLFTGPIDRYRIKPEPRVWFVIMTDSETYGKYDSLETAKLVRNNFRSYSRYLEFGIFRCEEIL